MIRNALKEQTLQGKKKSYSVSYILTESATAGKVSLSMSLKRYKALLLSILHPWKTQQVLTSILISSILLSRKHTVSGNTFGLVEKK